MDYTYEVFNSERGECIRINDGGRTQVRRYTPELERQAQEKYYDALQRQRMRRYVKPEPVAEGAMAQPPSNELDPALDALLASLLEEDERTDSAQCEPSTLFNPANQQLESSAAGITDPSERNASSSEDAILCAPITPTEAESPGEDDRTPAATSLAAPVSSEPPSCTSGKIGSSGNYMFPSDGTTFAEVLDSARAMSTDEIIEALRGIIDSECRTIEAYPSIRERFCAYNIALNDRNKKAPHLRPHIDGGNPKASERKPEHNILTNDLQIIDLHWLWSDKYQPASDKWAGIFGSSFDFQQANRFVTTVGAVKNKVNELGLSRGEMLPLRILRGESARSRTKAIRDLMDSAKGKIRAALKDPRSRQTYTALEMSNICYALLLADLDVHAAIKIAKQNFGLDLNQSGMTRRKKWLQDRKCIHPLT